MESSPRTNCDPLKTEQGIRFTYDWREGAPPIADEVIRWRNLLYKLRLVGAYPDGTGYGNLSVRRDDGFAITGAKTGCIEQIDGCHLSLVTHCDVDNHSIICQGPLVASSESVSHAVIYQCEPLVGAVIHVHSDLLWRYMLTTGIRTEAFAGAGTQEMTSEIRRLFEQKQLSDTGIFVMAGHLEGIMVFAKSLDDAGELLLDTCEKKGVMDDLRRM